MVDTTDLKSVDLIGREGSSPSTPNINRVTIEHSNLVQNFLVILVIICI